MATDTPELAQFSRYARSPESRDCSRIRTSWASRAKRVNSFWVALVSALAILLPPHSGARGPPSAARWPPRRRRRPRPRKRRRSPRSPRRNGSCSRRPRRSRCAAEADERLFSRLSQMCLKRRIRTPRAIPAFSHARGPRSDNQVPARRARTNTRTNETHAHEPHHRRRKRRRSPRTKLGFVICVVDARRNIRERKRTIS